MVFKNKQLVIYALAGGAIFTLLASLVDGSDRANWLNSTGLLLDLMGLAQLEISGVLQAMISYIEKADAKNQPLPSRYVREIIDGEETEWVRKAKYLLFSDPTTGVKLIAAGCVFQLIGTWA